MQFIDSIANGGKWVWGTLLAFALAATGSAVLLNKTAVLRYERDVNRMVFNDNLGVLEEVKAKLGTTADSLNKLVSGVTTVTPDQPYIVVSIGENKLWYKRGNEVLFETQVATGSGKTLVSGAGGKQYKFETPRGRLKVQEKEIDPAWVPPDWHFQEQANKRGLGLARMTRGSVIPAGGGAVVAVRGSEVVKRYPDGREIPLESAPVQGRARNPAARAWRWLWDTRHKCPRNHRPVCQSRMRSAAKRGHRKTLRYGARGHPRLHLLNGRESWVRFVIALNGNSILACEDVFTTFRPAIHVVGRDFISS
jgi:hypothetical protein